MSGRIQGKSFRRQFLGRQFKQLFNRVLVANFWYIWRKKLTLYTQRVNKRVQLTRKMFLR